MQTIFRDQAGFQLSGLHLNRASGRFRGWVARRASPEIEALLLSPCSAVHFWGVARRLEVLFVDRHGIVLSHHRNVKPGAWPVWGRGAWGVIEAISERCPETWQPEVFTWQHNRL